MIEELLIHIGGVKMKTQIIAHRGASKQAPENTFPAFNLAYEFGADGIETDVQLTKDDVPVLIHDEQLHRTTNGFGFIKDYTWTQLQDLDAGSWFSYQYSGTKIMSLEELLLWIQHKELFLNIELKNNKINYRHLEEIVYEMVNHFQLQQRTTLSTFNPKSIIRLKKINTNMELALLTSKRKRGLVSYVQSIGASALHIKYRLLTSMLVKQCKDMQLPVRVYTVNKMTHMQKCYLLRCDGIFTDVPRSALLNRFIHK